VLSSLYALVAAARRRTYREAGRQRRLARPVISVGNLRVGGSGKTPAVAWLARLLADAGEKPAILSRGYARRRPVAGVVVVSDGRQVLADLDSSGDEPLMLARAVPGVPVLVCRERFRAGVAAEQQFGTTVHLLDDGFQHLPLYRDVDLLVVSPDDVANPRTLPGGRLREPLSAAAFASALLVPGATAAAAAQLASSLGVVAGFGLARAAEPPMQVDAGGGDVPATRDGTAFAVAGIANPDRFFRELSDGGWRVAGTMKFADHHRYSARDVARIMSAARAAGADAIVTTEKDLMRLLPHRPFPLTVKWVPLTVRIEPADAFRDWILARLAGARRRPGEGAEAAG